jgi:Ni/Co efflux regulator RcnB
MMKRLFTTATAIATLAIPALSFAHAYQDQNDARSKNPAPAQTRQPSQRPAPAQAAPRPGHPSPSVIMKVNPPGRVVQRPSWNRGNPNWWRGRPEFRDYAGARPGFWYRPGFGYFRVDPRWYGFTWRIGGFVPLEFRNYYVQNPYDYGLPPPPYGYAYVYLGNSIALMSLVSGAIVQVFPNVY